MINIRVICLVAVIFSCNTAFAVVDKSQTLGVSPPMEGNYALPVSQQPGPLLSFGQNIINRNQFQLNAYNYYAYIFEQAAHNPSASFLYGITDSTSLLFNMPVASPAPVGERHTYFLPEVTLQLEHAFYDGGDASYQDEATVVGSLTLPVKSPAKVGLPPNGYGSLGYFIGATYNRMYVDWVVFFSPGVLVNTSSDRLLFGTQYFYQGGLGYNIKSEPNRYIFLGLLELNGTYSQKDKFNGANQPDSGGNLVLLTP